MTVTVIISVYKDIEALKLILDSLKAQTYKDFDILVSEDCQTIQMKDFLLSYDKSIKHISQIDDGWRKNIALNNAVRNSKGEYLIFLDGDIVPYKNFIKSHVHLSEKNKFLSGRRTELGPFFSKLIREEKLSYRILETFYLFFFLFLVIDKARHAEEGITFNMNGYLAKKLILRKKKKMMLVGCNFSCYKKDLELINGFDEDFKSPSIGEDVDLAWRFNHFGIYSKSVRYIANTIHLYHSRSWGDSLKENAALMHAKIKKEEYSCLNGLIKKEKK